MPLFRRPDGDLVKDESPVRRMIPYVMRGRNESAVYHDELIDLFRIRPWMRAYNQAHTDDPVTLFHIFLYSIGRGFLARPGLNRFVSGGRIYQRRGTFLSFAAKKKFDDKSPLVTIKLEMLPDESFGDFVKRYKASLGEGRSDQERTIDKEVKLALYLPGPILSGVMSFMRWLDRMNLMPGAMIKTDPLYCTAFIANLGSVGLDRTTHHMYEYGTASLFGVMGPPKKIAAVEQPGDKIVVREVIEMRWAFDERLNAGFYCAMALKHFSRIIEDPEKHLGLPGPVAAPVAPRAESA
jgi:hypothetical protein